MRPASKENNLNRLKQNYRVKDQALILYVKKIILEFLPRIFYRSSVRVLNLGPSRQPGRDQMTLFVIGNLVSQLRDKMRPFRTGPHEVHFTPQYVPKLRNFIDASLTNNPAYARRPVIAFAGPHRTRLFCVHSHGTKLYESKRATVLANPLLAV